MNAVFIINPNAGKGGYRESLIEKLDNLNIPYYFTERPGHATEIARKIAEEGDEAIIFGCGGEGTNYEIINGIAGHNNVSFGIIPGGTGNDFIKFFADREPFLNVDDQLSGSPFFIDLIKVESEGKIYYGLNSCSAGMDAMVCKNTIKFKKFPFISGSAAYFLGIIHTLFCRFGKKMDFIIDNKPLKEVPNLFAVCANAPYYGGGYKCAPKANPSDGKLNFSIIATRSKFRVLTILGKYRKGTHTELPYCYHGECEKMEYISEEAIPFNIDGEFYEFKGVKCEIVKNAVKLIIPRSLCEKYRETLTPVEEALIRED